MASPVQPTGNGPVIDFRPALKGDAKSPPKPDLAVKVENTKAKESADYLFDPNRADKLELSQNSLQDELALVRNQEQRRAQQESMLEELNTRFTQMKSILYQVAAAVAFDADGFAKIQRKLLEELRGVKDIMAHVDLPELTGVDLSALQTQAADASSSQQAVQKLQKSVENAAEAVEKAKAENEKSSAGDRVTKLLEVAKQNTTAALNTYNPEDVLQRADAVAEALRAQAQEAVKAQGHLTSDNVLSLLHG